MLLARKAIQALCVLLFPFWCYGKEGEQPHCTIGNFALAPSQQPGPLIGFGENIVGRNQTQVFLFGDDYVGKKKHFIDLVPGILYEPISIKFSPNP